MHKILNKFCITNKCRIFDLAKSHYNGHIWSHINKMAIKQNKTNLLCKILNQKNMKKGLKTIRYPLLQIKCERILKKKRTKQIERRHFFC